MKLQVRLFAAARQMAHCETLEVDCPTGATVADVRQAVASACPALAPLLSHIRFAVNTQYAVRAADRLLRKIKSLASRPSAVARLFYGLHQNPMSSMTLSHRSTQIDTSAAGRLARHRFRKTASVIQLTDHRIDSQLALAPSAIDTGRCGGDVSGNDARIHRRPTDDSPRIRRLRRDGHAANWPNWNNKPAADGP